MIVNREEVEMTDVFSDLGFGKFRETWNVYGKWALIKGIRENEKVERSEIPLVIICKIEDELTKYRAGGKGKDKLNKSINLMSYSMYLLEIALVI